MTTEAPTTTPTTSTQSKPRIRRIGETRYIVESKSQPGIGRQVDVATGACSCPAGRHGRRCYHVRWAQDYHLWRLSQAAISPVPAPVPATPAVEGAWHDSAAYRRLAQAFE